MAPTVIALGADAGERVQASVDSLPAAATTVIPAFVSRKIAEFNDLNDNDLIYVRWSVPHERAYMYSELDRPTQWVHPHWTIRKTIQIGMGMGQRVENYEFDIEDAFTIEHRERVDPNDGLSEFVILYSDNDVDFLKIERILNSRWNSYAANKICFSFQVR